MNRRIAKARILVLSSITIIIISLCVLGFPLSGIVLADEAGGQSDLSIAPWHSVVLADGETYDVSTASANTTVYITTSGVYTLEGSSSKVRVLIQANGVTVYLANGLNIDPGILANVGSRTAAITIDAPSWAQVRLISKPGATVRLGSYLATPAIRKDNNDNTLRFETEDPSNPGTIYATAEGPLGGGAGIGSLGEGGRTTGYIEFWSGNVVAQGANGGAGIGGGWGDTCYDISIYGGSVTAQGGSSGLGCGAGIGGGGYAGGYDIAVYGGTVKATGGDQAGAFGGAGIGGGHIGDGSCTIKGGNVTAIAGGGACGVGGGQLGAMKSFEMKGGTLHATGSVKGAGIGGDSNAVARGGIFQ